jgi:hypothetical protein
MREKRQNCEKLNCRTHQRRNALVQDGSVARGAPEEKKSAHFTGVNVMLTNSGGDFRQF